MYYTLDETCLKGVHAWTKVKDRICKTHLSFRFNITSKMNF